MESSLFILGNPFSCPHAHFHTLGSAKTSPFGLAGDKPGSQGENYLVKKDGLVIPLEGKVEQVIEAQETVVIQTRGGGGFRDQ